MRTYSLRSAHYCLWLLLTISMPTMAAHDVVINYAGDGEGKITGNLNCDTTTTFNCSRVNIAIGTTYTFKAEPAANSTFGGWACNQFDSNEPEQTYVFNGNLDCILTFNVLPNVILNVTNGGNGTVTSSPAGIDCGTTCSTQLPQNTEVTLTANPNSGFLLANWGGDSDCADGVINLANETNCTATFAPIYELTTSIAAGSGTISSDPVGINCGTSCSASYAGSTQVTLTAQAADGFAFSAWGGDADCADGIVTMDAAKNCTATFLPSLSLSITQNGDGAGTVTSQPAGLDCGTVCTAQYVSGATVALMATPSMGSSFFSWTGDPDCSDGQVTVDVAKTCTANFVLSGSPQFAEASLSVSEQVGNAVVTVKRVEGTQGELRVNYATADASAIAGQDYTATSGTLVWAHDDTADKSFSVPILLDAEAEATETLLLTLSNSTGGVIQQIELNILNVEVFSTVQFAIGSYTFNEADGTVSLLVTRAANSAGQISVDYVTNVYPDDTAMPGADFTVAFGTLTWANGDLQHKEISVPLLLDSETEAPEVFSVDLLNLVGGGALGVLAQTKITVLDTPPAGSLQFAEPQYSGSEGTNPLITVNRIGGGLGNVTVDYTTLSGSALTGDDFRPTQGTLSWVNGDVAAKQFAVPLLTDALQEGDETLSVILDNVTGGASIGARFNATLTVLDAFGTPVTAVPPTPTTPATPTTPTTPVEPPPPPIQPGSVQFEASTYSVAENGLSVTVTVTRSGGSDGVVSVRYTTINGTAQDGQDYVRNSGDLQWLDGDATSKTITIGLYDNGIPENAEIFSVQLSEPNGGLTLGNIIETQVTIEDNDATSVQLSASRYAPLETEPVLRIPVRRIGGDIGQLVVTYATTAGSATAGEDYQDTTGALTWNSGDSSNQFISIPLRDDSLLEGNETFSVRLLEVLTANAELVDPISAQVTIRDDDTGVYTPRTRSDGGLVIDGAMVDLSEPLENVVLITENGSVTRGQLGGYFTEEFIIESAGSLTDVTLLTGTTVNGGIISERITSIDPNNPATLVNVSIAPDTELSHIIIDGDSTVNTLRLGVGTLFEHNGLIPSEADLSGILGRFENDVFGQTAVVLTRDVLHKSHNNGILGGINGLPELVDANFSVTQDSVDGQLSFTQADKQYHMLPIAVTQILTNQVLNEIPLDMLEYPDGAFSYVTHTGRQIIAQPMLQQPQTFFNGLAVFGLDQVVMGSDGNLRVSTALDNSFYFMGRASNFSQVVSGSFPEGVNGETIVYMIYSDALGILRQQFVYPAAAFAAELQAFSNTSDSQTILYMNGLAEIHQGRGDSKQSYKGRFEYRVTTGVPPADGNTQIVELGDLNQDGLNDYEIIYRNGDRQLFYQIL